jgi:hypothetical protein
MAMRFWREDSALGKTFRSEDKRYVVAGVAKDVRSSDFSTDDGPLFYTPLEVPSSGKSILLVRMNSENVNAAGVIGAARSVAPSVEISRNE